MINISYYCFLLSISTCLLLKQNQFFDSGGALAKLTQE